MNANTKPKTNITPAPAPAPEAKICTHCGQALPLSSLITFDGELLCPDCLARETLVCSWCGDRIWRDNNYGTGDTPLCRDCYDDHYATCADCGRLIRQHDAFYTSSDSDEAYCLTCYQRHNDRSIHDYYYKPEPLFRGEGPRYFGVELEIDEAGEDTDHADSILDIANFQIENIYCKHDGSLDDGFEIVTHPMSLDYHMNEMPWLEVLGKAQQIGYPRLPPATYLTRACTIFGADAIRAELEQQEVDRQCGVEDFREDKEIPLVKEYVTGHLAARLEQEIYRCQIRNFDYDGGTKIFLFYPPGDVFQALLERFPGGSYSTIQTPPSDLNTLKRGSRSFHKDHTAFSRLEEYIRTWDGSSVRVSEVKALLGISDAVWKDLRGDPDTKDLLEQYNVVASGRGRNCQWKKESTGCDAA